MNSPSADDAASQCVLDFVGARVGLAFPACRRREALAAISRGIQREEVADAVRYCDLLLSDPRAFDELVAELTVGETYFFREPSHFEFVRKTVLPELALRPADQGPLRVWSAGCASGEEAWSLAMLFAEAGLAERTHILATDVSRAALARGRAGVYRDWSLRGDAADAARRWLHRQGESSVIDPRLRRTVDFAYLNLALDVYPSLATGTWGMDLIFCRNVLIYFERDAVRQVAARLFAALSPGGWLVTASSDPPLQDAAPWEISVSDAGVFYRRPVDSVKSRSLHGVADEITTPTRRVSEASDHTPSLTLRVGSPAAVDEPDTAELARKIHALANVDSREAERACREALSRYPLSAPLYYLHAVVLQELGQTAEVVQAARRAVYLDRSLAVAHFTLGVALERQGDLDAAKRAYRNSWQLCLARPPDEPVPLAEGERAGRLAEAAAAQLAILEKAGGGAK